MLKKVNLSSPVGIALTVAGLAIALSPELRRGVRKLMVKSTAGVMDAVDHISSISSGAANALSDKALTWTSNSKEGTQPVDSLETATATKVDSQTELNSHGMPGDPEDIEAQEIAFEAGNSSHYESPNT